MFRRRVTPSLLRRISGFFWPSLGWSRFFSYVFHRLGRMAGSPHSVAVGLACGAAVSFTPLIGVHILVGVFLAALMRGSLVASVIGTAIGNPWTFPVIWTATYHVGHWMLAGSVPAPNGIDFIAFFAALTGTLLSLDTARFTSAVLPVWGPMMVGSLPIAAAVWLVCYWPSRRLIQQYQDMRRARRGRSRTKRGRTVPHGLARRAD